MLSYLEGFQLSLRALQGLSESTARIYGRHVTEMNDWLITKGYPTDPREIVKGGSEYIEKYLEYCYYRKNENVTRRSKLTAIAKFFRYLKYKGVITVDITAEIPRPKVRRKFMITFSREEILRIFAGIDISKEKGLRDVCILVLLVFCGLRMNEIITLDLDAVADNGSDMNILIKGKQYAGDISRSVYLWKIPAHLLQQYFLIRLGHGARSSDSFLVSYNHDKPKGRRLTQAAIDKMIKKLAAVAGIRKPEIHAHMFRATHANDLQHIKGYTLPAIMERMGWKDLSTAGHYLVRRERIHRIYDSLHQYWLDFGKTWTRTIEHDEKKYLEYKGDGNGLNAGGDDEE